MPGHALDQDSLGKKARRGVALLILRTVLLQVTVFGGNIVLARVLEPAHFGVFAIVQFALSFFAFFGDAGLGGALVQKKEEPTERELGSVFSFQLILVVVLMVLAFGFASVVRDIWPKLPDGSEWLLRVLSLQLLVTAIRVPPSILMERHLQFGRLSALEVIHTLAHYGTAVGFALAGYGVWALVFSVLAQGVVGTVAAYAFHPWRPSFVIDRAVLAPILRFGLPYQAKTLIAFVNGSVTPLYAGSKLGQLHLGYINWAQNTAYFPLKLVEILQRVTFPLYSRMQSDPALIGATLGRSIYLAAAGTYFVVALFFGMGEQIIRIVFTEKWLPALPFLQIFAAAITLGFLAPLVASALDASGRPGVFARLSVYWTALNWVVVPITTWRFGAIGFVAGYSVHVVVGNLAVMYLLRSMVPGVRLLRQLAAPALAGLSAYLLNNGWLASLSVGWWSLGAALVLSLAAFTLVLLLLDRRGLLDALQIVPRKKLLAAPA